jgi:hypothetical protein
MTRINAGILPKNSRRHVLYGLLFICLTTLGTGCNSGISRSNAVQKINEHLSAAQYFEMTSVFYPDDPASTGHDDLYISKLSIAKKEGFINYAIDTLVTCIDYKGPKVTTKRGDRRAVVVITLTEKAAPYIIEKRDYNNKYLDRNIFITKIRMGTVKGKLLSLKGPERSMCGDPLYTAQYKYELVPNDFYSIFSDIQIPKTESFTFIKKNDNWLLTDN